VQFGALHLSKIRSCSSPNCTYRFFNRWRTAPNLLNHSPDGDTLRNLLLPVSSQTKLTLAVALTVTDTVNLTLTLNSTLTVLNCYIYVHFLDNHKKVFLLYKIFCGVGFMAGPVFCTTCLLI